MAQERFVIEIQDRIDPAIVEKLKSISKEAGSASKSISNIGKQDLWAEKLNTQSAKTALGLQRIRTEIERTAQAKQRLIAVTNNAAASELRLARAMERSSGKGFGIPSISGLGSLTGITSVAAGAYGIKQSIDDYQELSNRIRLVTTSEAGLNAIRERIFGAADRSRVSVLEMASAYQRYDMALKPLGASQEESLRFTETLAKATILSGSSTMEASQALRQFGQALNKGKLDGDEFRTVMETMPYIAEGIAKKLGVARGELLKLAPQGKITSQVMRDAVASMAEYVDKEIAKLPLTIDQTMTLMRNKLVWGFGAIEENSGLFKGLLSLAQDGISLFVKLAPAITSVAQQIKDLGVEIASLLSTATNTESLTNLLELVTRGLGGYVAGIQDTFVTPMKNFINDAKLAWKGQLGTFNKDTGQFELYQKYDMATKQWGAGASSSDTAETAIEAWQRRWADSYTAKIGEDPLRKSSKAIGAKTGSGGGIGSRDHIWATVFSPNDIEGLKSWESVMKSVDKTENSYTRTASGLIDELLQQHSLYSKLGKGQGERIALQEKLNSLGLDETNMTKAQRAAIEDLMKGISEKQRMQSIIMSGDPSSELAQYAGESITGKQNWTASDIKDRKAYYAEIERLRRMNLKNDVDSGKAELAGFMALNQTKIEVTSESLANISVLMQSHSRKMFEIGKAAAIAEATINGILAAQKAWKDNPNMWGGILAGSIAVATAANIAKIQSTQFGYMVGGYTGDVPTSSVAGVVHGKEFVVNAAATARNRAALEKMNSGGSSSAGVTVNIENYGSYKDFDVKQISEKEVRIIARDEMATGVPSIVAGEISNPNSRVSKSLSANTTLQRNR